MARKIGNGLDLSNQKITNLADGTSPTDAATKQQLDAAVRGLTWKAGVRAGSTANVTLSAPGATLDGVTLATNDRILLKNQTTASQNGIWVWTGSAVALVRAVDADSSSELVNATVTVAEGTVNADTTWTQTANSPISVDTTSLAFASVGERRRRHDDRDPGRPQLRHEGRRGDVLRHHVQRGGVARRRPHRREHRHPVVGCRADVGEQACGRPGLTWHTGTGRGRLGWSSPAPRPRAPPASALPEGALRLVSGDAGGARTLADGMTAVYLSGVPPDTSRRTT
jgi:hypothetical protein